AQQHAGVIHQVARGKVVGAVDHDVVVLHDVERVLAGDGDFVPVDLHEWIDVQHAVGGRVQFLASDVFGAVDNLPLQVRVIHHIEIHEPDAAHARCRQVQAQPGAPPPRPAEPNRAGAPYGLAVQAP